ncbi:MAG TPA: class I SAM-dependent methyltransferase [Candidatus Acidoferrales bacterium]|nr:class I SAM-dependent methyltransferase [Candidatus Acidoferrales bacterium]
MAGDPIQRWQQALLLPGETDIVQSSLRELSEFYGISTTQAQEECESAVEGAKREWESAPRQTTQQVLDFYRNTRSYIFEHMWWHATSLVNNSANVTIADLAVQQRAREYLDLGSGVGSNGLLFAHLGMHVTLADISRTMLDFARWRFQRRGIAATFIDLNEQELPAERYDFATAVDVFEHLSEPEAMLQKLCGALKVGGVLVFNVAAGFDPERPMHLLRTRYPVLRAVRRIGLRHLGREADALRKRHYTIVRRVASNHFGNVAWGIVDRLRYGSTAEAIRLARKGGGHP